MRSAWGLSWGRSWANAWGVISQADTHDGGDYYYKWWKKQHEKKQPQLEEIIEAVKRTPEQAIKAVPEAKQVFNIDYTGLKNNLQAQQFIAKKISIMLELKRLEDEEEERAIEMLLLSY